MSHEPPRQPPAWGWVSQLAGNGHSVPECNKRSRTSSPAVSSGGGYHWGGVAHAGVMRTSGMGPGRTGGLGAGLLCWVNGQVKAVNGKGTTASHNGHVAWPCPSWVKPACPAVLKQCHQPSLNVLASGLSGAQAGHVMFALGHNGCQLVTLNRCQYTAWHWVLGMSW